jgi:hypothetical protein
LDRNRFGHLVSKEFDQTFVNPVIVRLHDTLAIFVAEPEQKFFLNGGPDEWFAVTRETRADTPARNHFRRSSCLAKTVMGFCLHSAVQSFP